MMVELIDIEVGTHLKVRYMFLFETLASDRLPKLNTLRYFMIAVQARFKG